MNKDFLDVGLTIAKEIHELHAQKTGSLAYAGIISQLCLDAGVSTDGLVPLKPSPKIDLDFLMGAPTFKRVPTASTSNATSSKNPSRKKSSGVSSSKSNKVLRHLRVVQENLRRVHEHTKVCVMLEPLLRVVGAELNVPVEKFVPVQPFDKELIEDLMRFEEFSEDEEDSEPDHHDESS